jgi:hypothetical protein
MPLFSKSFASEVKTLLGKAQKIEGTISGYRNMAGQKIVDWLTLTESASRASAWGKMAAGAAVKDLFAECGLGESACKNYTTSVKLAYIHNVPFAASLFTKEGKEAAGIATESAGRADGAAKNGKVSTTTHKDLQKTLSKALAQARLLGLGEFVADLTDLCIDGLEDFKETILDK